MPPELILIVLCAVPLARLLRPQGRLTDQATAIVVPGLFVAFTLMMALGYVHTPDALFGDARIYFRATDAWLRGEDPWASTYLGTPFAGWPPTLLLSIPFIPFGEKAAVIAWPVLDILAAAYVVRRVGLTWWWVLFPPFVAAWFPASPDLALVALVYVGGGAISALTKPYAIPAMLGVGRWVPVLAAGLCVVLSAPVLPWGTFFAHRAVIEQQLQAWSLTPTLWGTVWMPIAVLAVISLGTRLGLLLATPVLWPVGGQLHYAAFSIEAAAALPLVAIGFALVDWNGIPISICVMGAVFGLKRVRQCARSRKVAVVEARDHRQSTTAMIDARQPDDEDVRCSFQA